MEELKELKKKHWCKYYVVKGQRSFKVNGKKWFERCKCGRLIAVECTFLVEGRKSPAITKTWYDVEGNIERITGASIE